jgi:hypothetical protein
MFIYNIFRKLGLEGVDSIHLAQRTDSDNSCEHSNQLSVSIKDGRFLG